MEILGGNFGHKYLMVLNEILGFIGDLSRIIEKTVWRFRDCLQCFERKICLKDVGK